MSAKREWKRRQRNVGKMFYGQREHFHLIFCSFVCALVHSIREVFFGSSLWLLENQPKKNELFVVGFVLSFLRFRRLFSSVPFVVVSLLFFFFFYFYEYVYAFCGRLNAIKGFSLFLILSCFSNNKERKKKIVDILSTRKRFISFYFFVLFLVFVPFLFCLTVRTQLFLSLSDFIHFSRNIIGFWISDNCSLFTYSFFPGSLFLLRFSFLRMNRILLFLFHRIGIMTAKWLCVWKHVGKRLEKRPREIYTLWAIRDLSDFYQISHTERIEFA